MMHATQWYADAMRLWKRGPFAFSLIALVILAANILLNFVPIAGTALAQLVLPLLECGLLYAALAADRGDQPRARHLIAFVAAPFRAQVAVVVAGLLVFAAEALVAQLVDGTNLLAPGSNVEAVSGVGIVSAYAAGIAVSLPLTFVPFVALFDGAGFRAAFAQSFAAFILNVGPLALFGALTLALLLLGIATNGVGLLLALPWAGAASYACWKDIFGVA